MLLEVSGEITPERMKAWSQSKNTERPFSETGGQGGSAAFGRLWLSPHIRDEIVGLLPRP